MCRKYNGVWVQVGMVVRGDGDGDGVVGDDEATYEELVPYHDTIISVIGSLWMN